ncbi:MAG: sulfotransferase [Acidimicrobiia bacterium]|nr:sulfotransferase [Acidimicrobiia bacterium]
MTNTLPNLIIAGIRKGGTTSLSHYLGQHPDICSSELKKVGFFLPLKYGEGTDSLDSYAAHFEHCAHARYRMEATTGYFLGGASIAQPMAEMLPDARVLIVLREPVDALWSHYRFVRSHLRIPGDMDFPAYVEESRRLMVAGEDGLRENNAYVAYSGGFYEKPLTEWADAFGDRLRVLFFDDLHRDVAAMLTELLEWLDIDTAPVAEFDFDVLNRSVQIRNRRLQWVALRVNEEAKSFFRRHHGIKRALRSGYYMVNRDRSPSPRLSPEMRAELRAGYADSNAATAALIESRGLAPGPLPSWLADPERR